MRLNQLYAIMRVRPYVRSIVLTLFAVAVAVPAFLMEGSASTAYALSVGEACIFDARYGALGEGHVGWGYQVGGTTTYVFGATEGSNAWNGYADKGQFNGFWSGQGNRNAMLAAFRGTYGGRHQNYYTGYRCERVANSAVGAANAKVTWAKNNGYNVFGNNCMDHAYAILSAYGANGMEAPWWAVEPNTWFDQLSSSWSPEKSL